MCWELEEFDQFHSRGEFAGQGSPRSKDLSGPLMSEYSNKLELDKGRERESEVWLSAYVVAQWLIVVVVALVA